MLCTLTSTVMHRQAKVLLLCLCVDTERNSPMSLGWGLWWLLAGLGTSRPKTSAVKTDTTICKLLSLGQMLQLLIEQPLR